MGNETDEEGFSFDASEFAPSGREEVVPEDDGADEALRDLEEQEEEPSEDPQLSDVDLRLEVADYYRAVLNHAFFKVESEAAKLVDAEMRAFIRERLEVLLGLRSPRAQDMAQFEDDEVQALKLLASKVLKKPSLMDEPRGQPKIKEMATPTRAQAPEMRPKPAVKPIPAPPKAPSTKPKQKAKPVGTGVAKAAIAQAQANGKVYVNPIENPEVQTIEKKVDTGNGIKTVRTTLVEGEIITEGGRKYKIVRNDMGTLFRRDITGQVVPNNSLPPMNKQQMEYMSAQHAHGSAAKTNQNLERVINVVSNF